MGENPLSYDDWHELTNRSNMKNFLLITPCFKRLRIHC